MSLKTELKNGAVVELRNGNRYLKIEDTLLSKRGGCMPLPKYDDDLRHCDDDRDWDIVKVNNNTDNGLGWLNNALREVVRDNKWTWERPKEILDEVEKAYLTAVIKPFRDKVDSIDKVDFFDKQFVRVSLSTGDVMNFPNFERGSMYKGMKVGMEYTLKELGL